MSSYHHRYSQPSTQSQAQVLETEFPLMGLPPITNPGCKTNNFGASHDSACWSAMVTKSVSLVLVAMSCDYILIALVGLRRQNR